MIAGAEKSDGLLSPIILTKPAPGESYEVTLEAGSKYFLAFGQSEAQSFVQKDGDLIITFSDDNFIVLKNFGQATQGDAPAILSFNDEVTDTELAGLVQTIDDSFADDVPDEVALKKPVSNIHESKNESDTDTDGQQVAKVEPAAGDTVAETLAKVEPAAGDSGGGSGARGGFGFQSSFDPQGVIALQDVGPINPTALQYGVNPLFDEVQILEAQGVGAPDPLPLTGGPFGNFLDETNINGNNISATGQVVVDFGSDGPGIICANGDFVTSGSLANNILSSGGVPVVMTWTNGGYTGTAGGVVIFTLTIDQATGEYIYTQYEPFDHADGTDPDDVIQLSFGIKAQDADGDTVTTTVTIQVADDAPLVASQPTQTVDETNLNGGNLIVNGTFVVDAGEDTPASISMDGIFNATGSLANNALTSHGVPVVVASTSTGYTGTAGGVVVFTITIDPSTGQYTYTQFGPLDHADGGDPNDVITLQFGAQITDFDGDSAHGIITINVLDDAPAVAGPGVASVDETNLGPIVINNTLVVNFGADGSGSV
ncbi:MAG: DUF5801 domain-containing protein, partial [Alphaproteobacteria bacterium]|nr:DUF5801 domain-containing protein [Alphaproteobacteria bacterium]